MPLRRGGGGASGVWWLLIALLVVAAAATSAEIVGDDARDFVGPSASSPGGGGGGGVGGGVEVVESAAPATATKKLPREEEEIIAEETEVELKDDGVKVELPDDEDLEEGDNVTMKYDSGEVVNETVPMDADVETEEVRKGFARTGRRGSLFIIIIRPESLSWCLAVGGYTHFLCGIFLIFFFSPTHRRAHDPVLRSKSWS